MLRRMAAVLVVPASLVMTACPRTTGDDSTSSSSSSSSSGSTTGGTSQVTASSGASASSRGSGGSSIGGSSSAGGSSAGSASGAGSSGNSQGSSAVVGSSSSVGASSGVVSSGGMSSGGVSSGGASSSGVSSGGSSSGAMMPTACLNPPVLSVTAVNQGTTVGQGDFSAGTCQTMFVRGQGADVAYTYTSPAGGRVDLHLALVSNGDHGIYVRGTCSAAAADVACVDRISRAGEEDLVVPNLAPSTPLFVFVGASRPETEAGFTLLAWEVPVVAASGACDPDARNNRCDTGLDCLPLGQGHTCRSHGTALANACASAATVTGGTYMGTTLGAPDFLHSTCDPAPNTGDVMVEYLVAGDAGNAVAVFVSLDSATEQAITVLDACDGAAQLDCRQATRAPSREQAELALVPAGTRLLLVVSPMVPSQAGAFSLTVVESPYPGLGGDCSVGLYCAAGQRCDANTFLCQPGITLMQAQARLVPLFGPNFAPAVRVGATAAFGAADVPVYLSWSPLDAAGLPMALPARATRLSSQPGPFFSKEFPPTGGTLEFDIGPFADSSRLASVRVVLVSEFGVSAAMEVPVLPALPAVDVNGSCAGFGQACVDPLRCINGTCQDVRAQACAAAPRLTRGVQANGTSVGATDVTAFDCSGPRPDVLYAYVTEQANSVVLARVTSTVDHLVTLRTSCLSEDEVSCIDAVADGEEGVTASGLPAGTTVFINVVPFDQTNAGTFTITVDESAGLAQGAACNPRFTNTCAPPLLCQMRPNGPPDATCEPPPPPFSVGGAEVRLQDLDADGALEGFSVRLTGVTARAGFVRADLLAHDAAGRPLDLYRRSLAPVLAQSGPWQLGGAVAVPYNQSNVTLGVRVNSLTPAVNLAQAVSMDVVVHDAAGASLVVRDVIPSPLPGRNLGQSCDAEAVLNVCAVGFCTENPGSTLTVCHDDASLLGAYCALAPTVMTGPITGDTTTSPVSVSTNCVGGPALLYRFVPAASGDVVATITNGPDVGAAWRTTCNDPGTESPYCAAPGLNSTAEIRDVVPGQPLFLLVGGYGPFTLNITHRPVLGSGPCDPTGQANRCAPGTTCFDGGGGPQCTVNQVVSCATTQTLVAGFNMLDVGRVDLTDVCGNPGVESMFLYNPTVSPADITIQVQDGLANAVAQYTDCAGINLFQCNPASFLSITRWDGGPLYLLLNEPAFASGVPIQVTEIPVLPTGAPCDPTGMANRCDNSSCVDQGGGPVCL